MLQISIITRKELNQAIQTHNSGMTWDLIATYFKTNRITLRKQINTMKELLTKYYELLQKAEQANDRREAIRCIRESTKLRAQMVTINTPKGPEA